MAEIVNLRRARKARARSEREKAAGGTRIRFGTATRERKLAQALIEKASKKIEAHKLDQADSDES